MLSQLCLLCGAIAHNEYGKETGQTAFCAPLYSFGKKYKTQKTGFWTWHKGNKAKHSEGHYVGGKQTGFWTEWYHGNPFENKEGEGHYVGNFKTGFWTYWYPGYPLTKWEEGHYEHGLRAGLWSVWYRDGNKYQEEHYVGGFSQRSVGFLE